MADDAPRRRSEMPEWLPWLVLATPIAIMLTLLTVRFFSAISGVLALVVFAEFLALALEPGVNWLAQKGWRRGSATALLLAVVVGVIVGAFVLVVPTFVPELLRLIERLPEIIFDLAERFGVDVSTQDIQNALTNERESLTKLAGDVAGNVLNVTSTVLGTLGKVATILFLAFYLTAEAPKVRRTVLSLFPKRRQQDLLRLWEISIDKVGGYLYSRTLMGILSGVSSYILLRILGVPFAVPLAIFIGFVSQFVPVVGTYIAYALPAVIALASQGFGDAVTLVVFAVVYQQLENLFISPRLSARTMKLHPAVAFVAALIGGSIGGVMWAFLALPVAAILQAFISTFLRRHEVISSDLTSDQPTASAQQARNDSSVITRARRIFRRSDESNVRN